MEYRETDKLLDEEVSDEPAEIELSPDIPEIEEDLDVSWSDDDLAVEDGLVKKTSKAQAVRFSLKARRAIEEHLERRRLRDELDYLLDE